MLSLCVQFVLLCVLYFAPVKGVFQSLDPLEVFRDCNYTTRCEGLFGFSDCKNGKCECRNGFYFANLGGFPFCQICPNFGDRCDTANCCRHSDSVACIDGFCRCKDSSMDSCLHFEQSTELMIAAKLALFGVILVSLAILLMVLRRSCGGEDYDTPGSGYRRDRIYASLNSIQRFVLAKMQDRPPPYDELEPPSKPPPYSVALSTQDCYGCEAPPPYSFSMFAQSTSGTGVSNPGFTDIPGTPDLSPSILPITLPSAAGSSAPPYPAAPERQEQTVSELQRPVLADPTVRRMSNYSTFTQPETNVTSGLNLEFPAPESTSLSNQTKDLLIRRVSTSERNPSKRIRSVSNPIAGPSFRMNSCSPETVVDWLGKEIEPGGSPVDHAVQTTDLPFHEPSTPDDWLTSTLGQVVQQPGPSTRRCSSEQGRSEESKILRHLGSLATFFISRRRGSDHSTVSDSSEPGSMALAHEYYSYENEDDASFLVSHIHPSGRVSTPELPAESPVTAPK
nr:PREDICTED: uncharacterized protein LOC109032600 isoform X1 [Bemisia tabaci]